MQEKLEKVFSYCDSSVKCIQFKFPAPHMFSHVFTKNESEIFDQSDCVHEKIGLEINNFGIQLKKCLLFLGDNQFCKAV